jgi:hypothetical protein
MMLLRDRLLGKMRPQNAGFSKRLAGERLVSLLFWAPMLISELAVVGVFWFGVQTIPGLFELLGYLFGILLAYYALDVFFQRRRGQDMS